MRFWCTFLIASFMVAGSAARAGDAPLTRPDAYVRAAALEALGRKLFFDPSLSASGKLACASCHDPARGFSAPNDRAVQLGGKYMRTPGLRAVPSLTYLQAVPQFTEHYTSPKTTETTASTTARPAA